EVIQLPQPATRGKREGMDGKCILATLSKNDRRGKSLKALSGLARPAGIEPATPAFGGQIARYSLLQLLKETCGIIVRFVSTFALPRRNVAALHL
ncbi:hypothetical protein J6348_28160, partial [Burkholderia pseudomallei]|nr:hypothetical protein [Burkholderia pseudomallei]